MKRICVFPGSFSPFTKGHETIVNKISSLFDKIIIAIGNNDDKDPDFSLEKRINWIQAIYKDNNKIETASYSGLTTEFCLQKEARFIVRGLRNTHDFAYEKNMCLMNTKLNHNIETIYVIPDNTVNYISSSLVRDIWKNGGDISSFVPKEVKL